MTFMPQNSISHMHTPPSSLQNCMEPITHNSSTRDRSRSRSRERRGRSRSRSRDRNSNNQRNSNKYRRGSQSPPNDRETYNRGSNLSSGPGYRDRQGRDRHSSSSSSNSADRKYGQRADLNNNRQTLSTNDNSQRSSRQQQQQQYSWRRDDNDATQREPQVEVILQGLPLDFQEDNVKNAYQYAMENEQEKKLQENRRQNPNTC
ncbi:hypothetical protein F5H01DRAFT_168600 [Linnemannia elongata]|nr:hypothetical protein F5H01DRAFT_168600 [Linnemannia elongata]